MNLAETVVHIFHTNDLHSHFEQWPKITAFLKEKRAFYELKHEDTLYVDLGDHVDRSHPLTEGTVGKANIALLNDIGVNAVTIGNNEGITLSYRQLSSLYDDANFPILVANIIDKTGERPRWTKQYEIIELSSGFKIGLIGVTAPFYHFYEQLGWTIENPFDTLSELVKTVKEQVDYVVLLSHLGLPQDEKLAESFDDIDLIIGAHTHHLLKDGKKLRRTYIAQAGKWGSHVGHVQLTLDLKRRQVTHVFIETHPMNEKQSIDIETAVKIHELKKHSEQHLNEPIIILPEPLQAAWFEESDATIVLAEGLKEWCGTELSMLNAGILLEGLPQGIITKKDIHRICPHPVNPCKLRIRGDQLKETIERAHTRELRELELKGFGFRGKVLGKMIFSGIEVDLKKMASGDEQVTEIKVLGKPLNLHEQYELATLDMFTFGKLYPALYESEYKTYYMPEFIRDILTWKLKSR
ncbi:MAG TPA: bifunctional metallophosphatase/5'-nucleotidase [Bacilli bacterium]|nr:bifunctional metallophosphatase/5'-nucleotidase [Bacilli bacterium]